MFDLIAAILGATQPLLLSAILVFVRVGAMMSLLPGFGETALNMRLKLAAALAVTVLVVPAVDRGALPEDPVFLRLAGLILAEAGIGLLLGLATRLMVHALQLAGSIAAQSTALAQIAGAGVAPDPMPAMGNALMISGIALAMVLGLHVKVVIALIASYQALGFGVLLSGSDVGFWGLNQAVAAFRLGFTLAAPFVIAALLYNLALGAINLAMPQLMVAFIGAPAITALTLFLFFYAAPLMLSVWSGRLDEVLAAPLELRR
ncbi:flagellar biosynthetic protein FliR [Oceanibium sediminis]|uniref:flagellar biosynthetic protein FliR n=1 Tax=Oceanibium sediminis TaxID=2026339 RepID=UPI000DD41F5C|nr:flagellar biosynthetic protein FliR [Oceanibium sediminis]